MTIGRDILPQPWVSKSKAFIIITHFDHTHKPEELPGEGAARFLHRLPDLVIMDGVLPPARDAKSRVHCSRPQAGWRGGAQRTLSSKGSWKTFSMVT